jgi:hypothetical protein
LQQSGETHQPCSRWFNPSMMGIACAPPILRRTTGLFPGLGALRVKTNLLSRINLICPVQSHVKKYSASHLTQIKSISITVHPTEGRIAIVTDAGLDAVDAAALGVEHDRRAGFGL